MACPESPREGPELQSQIYKKIINAIPVVENLYAAPTNLQRYKTLNRYRVHLRRLNAFLEERARKVHTLFEHSHDGSRDLYGRVEMVSREPIRILDPWITTVWLLDYENTNGVVMGAGNVLGDLKKAKRIAKRCTVRELRKMFPDIKKRTIKADIEASTTSLNGGASDGK